MRAMPATLPTTPPTTAFRVSGASPGGSEAVSLGAGTGSWVPNTPFPPSPAPPATMVGTFEAVEEVKSEVRLRVEEKVEREEDEVRVEFEKSATVWLLKSDGMRATQVLLANKAKQETQGAIGGTHLTKS